MADHRSTWSAEEERLLHHEALIAEALRIRKGTDTADAPKSTWLKFLESAGGVALITIIFGSIGAGVLNSCVQAKLKERELAVTAYQEQLKQQQEIVNRSYELVGDCVSTSEDLIFLTMSAFDPQHFGGDQRQKLIAQRTEMRKKYNLVDGKWRVSRQQLALLIGLSSHDQGAAGQAWAKVQETVTTYKNCAEDWYYQHQEYVSTDTARSACQKEKKEIATELDAFTRQIEGSWRRSSPPAGSFW